jgi:hypothetical protein
MSIWSSCPAGYYCATTGLSTTTGLCFEGYYCPSGSSSYTQMQCTSGNYCPTGSSTPTACPGGSNFNCSYAGMSAPCVPAPSSSSTGLIWWNSLLSSWLPC